jgi:hypothetical protein
MPTPRNSPKKCLLDIKVQNNDMQRRTAVGPVRRYHQRSADNGSPLHSDHAMCHCELPRTEFGKRRTDCGMRIKPTQ